MRFSFCAFGADVNMALEIGWCIRRYGHVVSPLSSMTGDPDGVWQYLVGTRHDLTHTKNISIKHAVRGEFSKVLTSLGTVLHPPQIEFDMNIHRSLSSAHILVSVDLGDFNVKGH